MIRNRWFHFIIGGVLGLLLVLMLNQTIQPFVYILINSNDSIRYFIGVNITFIPIIIITLLVITYYNKFKIKKFINQSGVINYKRFIYGFLIWFTFQVITVLYTLLLNRESLILNFNLKRFITFFLLSLIFTPIQVATEELLFRGYIIKFLQSINRGFLFSLIISGILFSIPHLSNPEVSDDKLTFFLIYFTMSLILAYFTLKYKGLEYSLGIHFANNFFAINILNYPNTPLPSSPIFLLKNSVLPLPSLIETVIFGTLLIIIIKKVENNNYHIQKK